MALSQARLRELLDYNPRTGRFTWRIHRGGKATSGAPAGEITNHGRRLIVIDGEKILASHIAWFWMKGRWSTKRIDHKNGISTDDRWSNLRQATQSQNIANSRARLRLLPKGVKLHRGTRYTAQICVNYRTIHLGCFDTPKLAHTAYVAAARKYFGEFARAV